MTAVVVTHAVGDMKTWLEGGTKRADLFSRFSKSYRIFQQTDGKRVSVVWEDVDLDAMKVLLASPEAKESQKLHSVVEPIEVFVEIGNGR